MQRIKRGWELSKQSWAVLRADSSLAVFPVLGFICSAIAFVLIAAPGAVVASAQDNEWYAAPFIAIAAYAATFFGIYFNVALAAAANRSIDGVDTTLSDGLSVANARKGVIAQWALVQLVIGFLIQALEELLSESPAGRLVGAVVGGVLDAAWALMTFFVAPVLALEDVGPKQALDRSFALIKERWGESVVGTVSIGLAVWLGLGLPAALLVLLAFSNPAIPAVALIVPAVLLIITAGVISSALSVIFRVALYRYAVGGSTGSAFDDSTLASAFGAKR